MSQEATRKIIVGREELIACYKFVTCKAPVIATRPNWAVDNIGVYAAFGTMIYYGATSSYCMFMFKDNSWWYEGLPKDENGVFDARLYPHGPYNKLDNFMKELTKQKDTPADITEMLSPDNSCAKAYLDILDRFTSQPENYAIRNVNMPYDFPTRVKYATGHRLEELRMYPFIRKDNMDTFAKTGVYESPVFWMSQRTYLSPKHGVCLNLSAFDGDSPFNVCFIAMPLGMSQQTQVEDAQNDVLSRMQDFILPAQGESNV